MSLSTHRRTGSYLCGVILLSIAVLISESLAQNAASPPTATLPTGAMQAKATTACTECHEARIIVQQRLSKASWTKEVDKMTKWGALVDPADRDPLIDYLSANFSPDKPPYVPPFTANGDSRSARSKAK
jgi:hypothetical protein